MDASELNHIYGDTVYRDPGLAEFRGNPLIEALPPILPWRMVMRQMMEMPSFDPSERDMATELRIAKLPFFTSYFQPLSVHRDLCDRLSSMMRYGYLKRNPLDPITIARRRMALRNFEKGIPGTQLDDISLAEGLYIIGISGIGKSRTIRRILRLFPSVRVHVQYGKQRMALVQVPWLLIETPHDGSRKSICMKILAAFDNLLGTSYYADYVGSNLSRVTVDQLLIAVASVIRIHELGILVVDETQHLKDAKSEGSTLALNFFVELVNTIGVPVVLIGTFKAEGILTKEFRGARRGATHGDLWWNRMTEDKEWNLFASGIFDYQIVRDPVEFEATLSHTLYDMCQGIPALGVSMMLRAQYRAMVVAEQGQAKEQITPGLLRSVYEDDFRSLHKALRALRTNDINALKQFEDVYSAFVKKGIAWKVPDTTGKESVPIIDISAQPSPGQTADRDVMNRGDSAFRLQGSLYKAVCDITTQSPNPASSKHEVREKRLSDIYAAIASFGLIHEAAEFLGTEA